MTQVEAFVEELEKELHDRYVLCEDFSATPSSILLAVLNAVAAAKQKIQDSERGGK